MSKLDKKNKKSSKDDYKTYPLCIALKDKEDRYGHKFKNDFTHIPFTCMCCNRRIRSYLIQCSVCDYEYSFCSKCKNDVSIIFGFGACIFCERERNDKISDALIKIVGPPSKNIENDLYGRVIVEQLLQKYTEKS